MTKNNSNNFNTSRPIGLNLGIYKPQTEGTDAHGRDIYLMRDDNPTRIDMVTDELIYLGWAEYGSSESDQVWKIRKIILQGTVWKQLYANGEQTFVNSWTDRSIYNYK